MLVTYWSVDFTLLFKYPYFFGGQNSTTNSASRIFFGGQKFGDELTIGGGLGSSLHPLSVKAENSSVTHISLLFGLNVTETTFLYCMQYLESHITQLIFLAERY